FKKGAFGVPQSFTERNRRIVHVPAGRRMGPPDPLPRGGMNDALRDHLLKVDQIKVLATLSHLPERDDQFINTIMGMMIRLDYSDVRVRRIMKRLITLRLHDPTKKLLLVTDPKTNMLKQYYSRPARKVIDQEGGAYVIDDEDKWFMCCGAFLKGYQEGIPSYVEDMGLAATELGYGHIEVRKGMPAVVELVKV
ncbi:MAG TPA: hypothetical protein VLH13_00055, partial [Methanomassiliicoccales archaeon]|nr:hypothetical protein [Methanomassiliicoccales archaeon]